MQVVEKTTLECCLACWTALWAILGVDAFTVLFKYIIQLATLDSAGTNKKHDRHAHKVKTVKENILTAWCETHRKHTVAGHMYRLFSKLVSGSLAYSYMMRPFGMFNLLQRCISCFFRARLRFHAGIHPPRFGPAVAHRRKLLELLHGTEEERVVSTRDTVKYEAFSSICNGCLYSKWVDHWCPGSSHCRNKEACLTTTDTVLTPAILANVIEIYSKHRWDDADKSWKDAAASLAPFGMGTDIIPIAIVC